MPSVEELLSVAEVDANTRSAMDSRIEIDADTRIIQIMPQDELFGVESDEKSERKYFKVPKIVGNGVDLSKLQLRINYQNASKIPSGKDMYIVTDATVYNDEWVYFSWELSRKVTQYKGNIYFIVCAVKADSDGNITNEWNTTLAEGKVLEGLEIETSQEQQYQASDYLEQLKQQLLEYSQEIKDTFPSDYTQMQYDIGSLKGDLSQLSEENAELKGDMTKLNNDNACGKVDILLSAEWEKGNIANGSFTDSEIRLRTKEYVKLDDETVTITPDDGYKVNLIIFDENGTYIAEKGFKDYSYDYRVVDANNKYMFVAADINNGTVTTRYGNKVHAYKNIKVADGTITKSKMSEKTVTLTDKCNPFVLGTGFDGENYVSYKEGSVSEIIIHGKTEAITESSNAYKSVNLYDYCKFYTYNGTSLVKDKTSLSEIDGSNIINGTGEVISCETGYNQMVICVDLLSAYAEYASTVSELQNLISSAIIAVTGYIESSDNTICFKQANGFGNWIGSSSSDIVGNVPSTNNRNVGNTFMDSEGKMWVILYSNVTGNTILHIDQMKLTTVYGSGITSKHIWHIGSRSKTAINNGFRITFNSSIKGDVTYANYNESETIASDPYSKPLRSAGSVCDELHIYSNGTMTVIRNTDCITLALTESDISVESGDFDNTIVKIPLTMFVGIKTDNPNIAIYNDTIGKFDVLPFENNQLINSCYIDESYLYINLIGEYTSDTAINYLNGSLVIYELENQIRKSMTKSFVDFSLGEKIGISCGYLNPQVSYVLNTNLLNEPTRENRIVCDSYYPYMNKSDAFEDVAFSKSKEAVFLMAKLVESDIRQKFIGTGAALTESAAYMLMLMAEADRTRLLKEMYGDNELSTIRICFGQSDFRVESSRYTYDDTTDDYTLDKFSIGDELSKTMDYKYVIPVLKQIISINPNTKIIACPWFYPTWLTQGDWSEKKSKYIADYLIKCVDAYENIGFKIHGISVLNEPEFFPTLAPHIAEITQNYVGIAFAQKYPDIKIIGFESNYRETTVYETVKKDYKDFIDVIGAHTYNGTVDSDIFTAFLHKNKELGFYVTERRCMLTDNESATFEYMAKQIGHDAVKQGCEFITLWNMALDESGKPCGGGNTGRRGVLTISSDGKYIVRNFEYYMLCAMSKGIGGNAHIVATKDLSDRYIYTIGFVDGIGNTTLIIYNFNGGEEKVNVNIGDEVLTVTVKPYGITRVHRLIN